MTVLKGPQPGWEMGSTRFYLISIWATSKEMTYLCIPAADLPTQNLTQYFKESIIFMHECRLKGEGCLVHCLAGVSRSVTLVVAYIVTVTGLGWREALAAVRAVRPCAGPNEGFQRQLQEFEKNEAQQYRDWLRREYKETPLGDEEHLRSLLLQASESAATPQNT